MVDYKFFFKRKREKQRLLSLSTTKNCYKVRLPWNQNEITENQNKEKIYIPMSHQIVLLIALQVMLQNRYNPTKWARTSMKTEMHKEKTCLRLVPFIFIFQTRFILVYNTCISTFIHIMLKPTCQSLCIS